VCPRLERGGGIQLRNHNFVPGQGPEQAEVLVIGEAPGKQANTNATVFGGNGKTELEENYLRRAGLKSGEVRFTNVVKCAPRGFNSPTDNTIRVCGSHFLDAEIRYCNPNLIITMGASALKHFQGMVVRGLGSMSGQRGDGTIDLDMDHGFPLLIEDKDGETRVLIPMYGAAAGMVDADFLSDLMDDFDRVKAWRDGTWESLSTLEHVKPEYRELRTKKEMTEVFERLCYKKSIRGKIMPIAIDTEELPDGTPYCVTFALSDKEGFLVMANRPDLIQELDDAIRGWNFKVVCHYYLHDEEACRRLGLYLPISVMYMRDTMMDAYHLQLTSQSLKVLSWRLLGIRMREFMDVVRGPSMSQLKLWLEVVGGEEWDKGIRKPRQTALHKKALGMLKKIQEEEEGRRKAKKQYNPWEAWDAIPEEQRMLVENPDVMGPIPRNSIEWVEAGELLAYACQDAISTWRLIEVLQKMAVARRRDMFGKRG
jgi:uracil-DNA glycosylase family 4